MLENTEGSIQRNWQLIQGTQYEEKHDTNQAGMCWIPLCANKLKQRK